MDDKKRKDENDSLEQLMMNFGGVKEDIDDPAEDADGTAGSTEISDTTGDGFLSPFADNDFSASSEGNDSRDVPDEDDAPIVIPEVKSSNASAVAENISTNAEQWRDFPKSSQNAEDAADDNTADTADTEETLPDFGIAEDAPEEAVSAEVAQSSPDEKSTPTKSKKGKKSKKKKAEVENTASAENAENAAIVPPPTPETAAPEPESEPVKTVTDKKPEKQSKKEKNKENKYKDKNKKEKINTPKAEKPKKEKTAKVEKTEKKAEAKVKKEKAEKPAKTEKVKKKQEKADKKPKDGTTVTASPARLIVTLTAICAAAAILLAAVNYFTSDKIASAAEAAALSSVTSIFDSSVAVEKLDHTEFANEALSDVYLVTKDGALRGYAASVSPSGFGGAIDLMVGVSSSGEVVGVRVISMSETPGLGSKVGADSFLSRFTGKSGTLTAGEEIEVISGASISSKAVISGVSSVTSSLLDLESIAAARGLAVEPYVRGEVVVTTVPETEAPVVPTAPETAPPEDIVTELSPRVDKVDYPPENIVENPNPENFNINADYEEDTSEFETLTTEPESTLETESAAADEYGGTYERLHTPA